MTATAITTVTATSSTAGQPNATRARDALAALVRRNLLTTARVPQLLMFSLTMPMAMLILFSQVFRSVADSSRFPDGVTYIDFVTPAMLAVTTVMAGTNVVTASMAGVTKSM